MNEVLKFASNSEELSVIGKNNGITKHTELTIDDVWRENLDRWCMIKLLPDEAVTKLNVTVWT